MIRLFALLSFSLLIALPVAVSAQTKTSKSCTGLEGACLLIDESESTDQFIGLTRGNTYYVVFDPDTNSTGTATAQLVIFGPCATSPAGVNTCEKLYTDENLLGGITASALTGDCGSGGTNLCRRHGLPGGLYWIDITVAPGAGEDAVLNFEVEQFGK